MKTYLSLIITLCVISTHCISQQQKIIIKSYSLIEERSLMLNSGSRSMLGGKSRTSIQIDLPEGTKEWYYSFTTKPGPSGMANLNLAMQLSTYLLNPIAASGINLSSIKIPEGTGVIDAMILDQNNNDLFIRKADLNGVAVKCMREGRVENTKQGIVRVDDIKSGTWYLGLKNPSSMNAINIYVEVVAIVEEKVSRTAEEEKAVLYGNLGWKAYEKGEYDKCMELSKKALELNPDLGYVWGNIGLVQLLKNDYITAIDSYANAIRLCKASDNPQYYLKALLKDLDDLIQRYGDIEGAKDLKETVKASW